MKQYNCGFLISQIKQLTSRELDRRLAERNIDAFNGAQGRILYVLWQQNGVPIREISHKTGLSAATLTGMLDRMEAANLVRRVDDPNDRRKQLIELTEEARNLQREYDAISAEMDSLYFKGFSEKEADKLQSLLERVLSNLEEAENSEK